ALVAVAPRLQAGPEGRVVVDLAVEHDPDRAVLVGHGLVPAGHVHDGQPPVAQRHRAVHEQALPVGTTVAQDVAHPLEAGLVHPLPEIPRRDPGDAAHGVQSRGTASPPSSNMMPTMPAPSRTSGRTAGGGAAASAMGRRSVITRNGSGAL